MLFKGFISVNCIVIFIGMIMFMGIVNIMFILFIGGGMCGFILGMVSSFNLWMG